MSGYLRAFDGYIGDVAVGVARLVHQPIGLPPRCMRCNMTWPCDRRRWADEMERKWAAEAGKDE